MKLAQKFISGITNRKSQSRVPKGTDESFKWMIFMVSIFNRPLRDEKTFCR